MYIKISNVITVYEPTKEFKEWCKSTLMIPNPEYQKRAKLGLWLGNTPPKLALYKKVGNNYQLPYGLIVSMPYVFDFEEIIYDTVPCSNLKYPFEVPLYDYQKEAVKTMLTFSAGILESPAGSGKTQMGIAMIIENKSRALWLTHTKDLLNQSLQRAKQYVPSEWLGTITEGSVNVGQAITFATVQTMSKLDLSQYADNWDMVIVDECHRCSGTPTQVKQFYKVLNALKASSKYGLSATVHRADGMIKSTYALLGEVIYSVPSEAVSSTVLPVTIQPTVVPFHESNDCYNTDGTINFSGLISHLCEDDERNQKIIEDLMENQGQASLILSDRVNHLENLMENLPINMKKDAVIIHGKMTGKQGKKDREKALEDMRTGEKRYLFATYALAKEGLDIPCLNRLYMTTPKRDETVITQSIGRIARTFQNKQSPICYDYVDNMPYLQRVFKKRRTIYRKNNCRWGESKNESQCNA